MDLTNRYRSYLWMGLTMVGLSLGILLLMSTAARAM